MDSTREHCFSVSEVTKHVRELLENAFPRLTVEGEISNFRPSSTGHFYFSLKDKDAVISVVMFKYRARNLNFTPQDGQLVRVTGNISVYAKRGTYQIIADSIERAGEGDILAMLEQRKRALAEEGLFEEFRKKPLPRFPERIAVVTSSTGAALRDILRVLRRRNSGVNLIILPTPVQGEEAAEKIAAQIIRANQFQLGEVIIVGRGGGSLEDLLPFSEENVVRAIYNSKIPVISAVGHEIDVSLSDLAADMRAPTPSAAAEVVVSNREDLVSRIGELKELLVTNLKNRTAQARTRLSGLSVSNLEYAFRNSLQPRIVRLDDAKEQLLRAILDKNKEYRHKLEILTHRLESYSPQQVLKRGYAVVTRPDTGKLVTDAGTVNLGEEIVIRLAKGSLDATVKEKNTNEEV